MTDSGPGPVLIEQRVRDRLEEHAIRVTEDGVVWEWSSVDARWDGQRWTFAPGPSRWERQGTLSSSARAELLAAIDAVPHEAGPDAVTGTVRDGGTVSWRIHRGDQELRRAVPAASAFEDPALRSLSDALARAVASAR